MSVIVMLCFARSGGTVLNQVLGSLPNVVMISEVNPLGGGSGREQEKSFRTIKSQAKNWYDIEIKSDDYGEGIKELEDWCIENGKQLIVRDWPFINFASSELNDHNPAYKFLALEEIGKHCDEVKPFGFIRDSIDVWISRGAKNAEDFFREYEKYVDKLLALNVEIFKFEEFCSDTENTVKAICKYTGLEFSEDYKNYNDFYKVNGDVQIVGGSRGMKQKKIAPLKRKEIKKKKIRDINRNKKMKELNELFGYTTSYEGVNKISLIEKLKKLLKGPE